MANASCFRRSPVEAAEATDEHVRHVTEAANPWREAHFANNALSDDFARAVRPQSG